ncbi:MAG: response regulator [Chloroflexi bacterium]|nr:response regulator [Chloroflexota bacterium]
MARIFVIDDDEQLLRMVGLMLERGGHSITLINKPRNGFEQLEADKPDLLVLDVMMPGMSGHDLTRHIRASSQLKDLPILILTARAQDIDRDTALASGADDYLSKPVTSQELIERVDKLLTKKTEKPKKPKLEVAEQGMVLAFYGLRGGVGKTTLATNLALALRHTSRQEVCLVDLSPAGGQATLHLNLHAKPHPNWANLATLDGLDWPTLQEHLIIHRIGMRVLAAPTAPQPPSLLSDKSTARIVSLLRDNMMFTVLDLPPVLNPSFMAALKMADVSLHVITPDIVSVRMALQTSRALAKSGVKLKQASYILNQVATKAQLSQEAVERAVGGRIPFQINFDPNQARALTKSVSLALSDVDSPVPIVIKRMASVIWKRMAVKRGMA